MATFRYDGLDEYIKTLQHIGSPQKVRSICGKVIYSGAAVVADAMRKEIEDLPTVDHRKRGTPQKQLEGITTLQKKGLLTGFGISKLQRDDSGYNVKLGFSGTNQVKTNLYPGGQPNAVIARSVNDGTSFRKATRFVKKAFKKSKKAAETAMAEKFGEELEKALQNWD